jgi:hypothetical protein
VEVAVAVGEGHPTAKEQAVRATLSFATSKGDEVDRGVDSLTRKNQMIDRRLLPLRRIDLIDEQVRCDASSTRRQLPEETHELGWGLSS